MTPQLWMPKVAKLPPLVVVPNGAPDTCRCQELGKLNWQEKPVAVLNAYYRQATEEEVQQLLPEVA